jgi:hypothetical protein
MPDAIITSTESTFGTISGTFAADQSTITGTVTGTVTGTLSGSVGVPGPQGQQGIQGIQGVPGESLEPTVQNSGSTYNNAQFTHVHYTKELVFVISGVTYALPARIVP